MRGPINSTMKKIWKKICNSKDYRDSFVSAHLSNTVAAQISLMREDRDWTQLELAEKAGMKQSRISTLEDPNYENIEIVTLKRLASAFDVGLTIRFVPLSELVSWAEHHTAHELTVPSIKHDALEVIGQFGDATFAGAAIVSTRPVSPSDIFIRMPPINQSGVLGLPIPAKDAFKANMFELGIHHG